ncbi:MAG: hypothetical protein P8Z31_07315 [Gammaproteobacteria bacterium]
MGRIEEIADAFQEVGIRKVLDMHDGIIADEKRILEDPALFFAISGLGDNSVNSSYISGQTRRIAGVSFSIWPDSCRCTSTRLALASPFPAGRPYRRAHGSPTEAVIA